MQNELDKLTAEFQIVRKQVLEAGAANSKLQGELNACEGEFNDLDSRLWGRISPNVKPRKRKPIPSRKKLMRDRPHTKDLAINIGHVQEDLDYYRKRLGSANERKAHLVDVLEQTKACCSAGGIGAACCVLLCCQDWSCLLRIAL